MDLPLISEVGVGDIGDQGGELAVVLIGDASGVMGDPGGSSGCFASIAKDKIEGSKKKNFYPLQKAEEAKRKINNKINK